VFVPEADSDTLTDALTAVLHTPPRPDTVEERDEADRRTIVHASETGTAVRRDPSDRPRSA